MHNRKMKSILVVTQYFHVPRARLALQRFGIGRVYAAHAHFFEWRDIYSTMRELAGWVQYRFRDYPAPLPENGEPGEV